MMDERWSASFTVYAAAKLDQNLRQIVRCARLLNAEELWSRENEHCNSVGNQILHLTGNVRQWIVAGIGGAAFDRDRAAEFARRTPLPVDEITTALEAAVNAASDVIRVLDAAALTAPRTIQGYRVSTLEAVFHVVEHFSFHTGQIVHITKARRDVDLSLYDAHGHKPTNQPMVP